MKCIPCLIKHWRRRPNNKQERFIVGCVNGLSIARCFLSEGYGVLERGAFQLLMSIMRVQTPLGVGFQRNITKFLRFVYLNHVEVRNMFKKIILHVVKVGGSLRFAEDTFLDPPACPAWSTL